MNEAHMKLRSNRIKASTTEHERSKWLIKKEINGYSPPINTIHD